MKRDGALESIWQPSVADYITTNSIPSTTTFDAVVIGAGITGITTALLLQKAGKKVVIAEAANIGFGTTGGTTAHLNNFFDTSYDKVIDKFGEDNAKLLVNAAIDANNLIQSNAEAHATDCGYKKMDGYIFAITEDQQEPLEKLATATKAVGVDIELTTEMPFPIPANTIYSVPGQAQFNPLLYIHSLAKAFEEAGGIILQQCRVTAIDEAEVLTVHTSLGILQALNAVYATHVPPGVNLLHFRCAPYRSYAIAVQLKSGKYPQALGYDMCEPYHYYRPQKIGNKEFLIAGGEDHKTGDEENTEQCFSSLESYVSKYFDVDTVAYKWSSQYFEPTDGLPYIGHLPGNRENIYTATGFGGNGMIYGTLSAIILSDLIVTGQNKYAALFSPARVKPVAGFQNFMKEAADVTGHFIGDRFSIKKLTDLADLASGEAKVVKYDGETVALYKDEEHNIHAVNPSCTHINCIVGWNNAEKSWDCPCHGSRFSFDGVMLTAPARKDLEKINITEQY